ncbi:TPA: leucine-rich repeat protein [Streptococcus suis]
MLIPEGVTAIGSSAFAYTNIANITLPTSLERIGSSAFSNTKLSSVIVPDNVKTIGSDAFRNTPLELVVLPREMTDLGSWAFAGTKLSILEIPEGITSIDDSLYADNEQLKRVYLPKSLTSFSRQRDWLITEEKPEEKIEYYVYIDSYALEYMIENQVPFKLRDENVSSDESKLLDAGNSFYLATSSSSRREGYLGLDLKYSLKDGKASDNGTYKLRLNIPTTTSLYNGNVRLDGQDIPVTLENGYINLPVTAREGRVKLTLKANNNNLTNVQLFAQLAYEKDGRKTAETIGAVNVVVPVLQVTANAVTSRTYARITGIADPADSLVAYLDGVEVGSIKVKKDGTYQLDVPFTTLENNKEYLIRVEATSPDGQGLTASTTVRYEEGLPELENFIMRHNGYEYNLKEHGDKAPTMVFRPGAEFEFEANYTNTFGNDSLYLISTREGIDKVIELYYDYNENKYIFKGRFDEENQSYVPGKLRLYFERGVMPLMIHEQPVSTRSEKTIYTDTDGDGYVDEVSNVPISWRDDEYNDKSEKRSPNRWDVGDRDLAIFSLLSYVGSKNEGLNDNTDYNEIKRYFGKKASKFVSDGLDITSSDRYLFENWEVSAFPIEGVDKIDVYRFLNKSSREAVIAIRGTDGTQFLSVEWLDNLFNLWRGASEDKKKIRQHMRSLLPAEVDYNISIVGHSRGSYLAYHLASEMLKQNDNRLKQVITFNGVGLASPNSLTSKFIDSLVNVLFPFKTIEFIKNGFSNISYEGEDLAALREANNSNKILLKAYAIDGDLVYPIGEHPTEVIVKSHKPIIKENIRIYPIEEVPSTIFESSQLLSSEPMENGIEMGIKPRLLTFDWRKQRYLIRKGTDPRLLSLYDIPNYTWKPQKGDSFEIAKIGGKYVIKETIKDDVYLNKHSLPNFLYHLSQGYRNSKLQFNKNIKSDIYVINGHDIVIPIEDIKWAIDPSGIITNADSNLPVRGATTTVYYRGENGEEVLWDAGEYSQLNPLSTTVNGEYAWDVPEGYWKVKVEKEGYESAESEWLPVPPPQTEVHFKLKPHAYTIAYYAGEGSMPTTSLVTTYKTDVAVALPQPTRKGYKFAGWFEDSSLTGVTYLDTLFLKPGDKTLFAKWERATKLLGTEAEDAFIHLQGDDVDKVARLVKAEQAVSTLAVDLPEGVQESDVQLLTIQLLDAEGQAVSLTEPARMEIGLETERPPVKVLTYNNQDNRFEELVFDWDGDLKELQFDLQDTANYLIVYQPLSVIITRTRQEVRVLTTDHVLELEDSKLVQGHTREEASINGQVVIEITETLTDGQVTASSERELSRTEATPRKIYRGTKVVSVTPVITTRTRQEVRILTTDQVLELEDSELVQGQTREEASINGQVVIEITETLTDGQVTASSERELSRTEAIPRKIYRGTKMVSVTPVITTRTHQEVRVLTTDHVLELEDSELAQGLTREEASINGQVVVEITETLTDGQVTASSERELSRTEAVPRKVYRGTKTIETPLVTQLPTVAPTAVTLPTVKLTRVERPIKSETVVYLEDPTLPVGEIRVEEGLAGLLVVDIAEYILDGQIVKVEEFILSHQEATPRKVFRGRKQERIAVTTEQTQAVHSPLVEEEAVSGQSLPNTGQTGSVYPAILGLSLFLAGTALIKSKKDEGVN